MQMLQGSTLLYKPNANFGSLYGVQTHWVLDAGPSTSYEYKKGCKVMTQDGACFVETTDLKLWEDHKNDPEFEELRLLQEETKCQIETKLMYENRIIMAEDTMMTPRGVSHDSNATNEGTASED